MLKAALEGLARYAALLPAAGKTPDPDSRDEWPPALETPGALNTPLLLPKVHNSPSIVPIWGHRTVVLPRPNGVKNWLGNAFAAPGFTRPQIGLDGRITAEWLPYESEKQPDPLLFARFRPTLSGFDREFPIVVSSNGTRARVGWEQGFWTSQERTQFDLELRKIDGRWVCVECQRISPAADWRRKLPAPGLGRPGTALLSG
jgi:hypothetical protein